MTRFVLLFYPHFSLFIQITEVDSTEKRKVQERHIIIFLSLDRTTTLITVYEKEEKKITGPSLAGENGFLEERNVCAENNHEYMENMEYLDCDEHHFLRSVTYH